MTEQEYINMGNLTVVRIVRAALKWATPCIETKPHFDKIFDATIDLIAILNNKVTPTEKDGGG